MIPLNETHQPAARSGLGQGVRSREAVEHAADPRVARLADHRRGVVLRLPGVDDHGAAGLARQRELVGEGATLLRARRVVVVVVEAALADGHRALRDECAQPIEVTGRVVSGGVVRMHAGRPPDEPRMGRRDATCALGGLEGLADADDPLPARVAHARDHGVAVRVELLGREVGVRVDPGRRRRRRAPARSTRRGPGSCDATNGLGPGGRGVGAAVFTRGYRFSIQ